MGLYKRQDSRFWWMAYTLRGGQRCESTKTPSKELAKKILQKREAEIVLGRFKVGWAGDRMTFAQLSEEFLRSHSSTLSPKSQENHQMFLKSLRAYFGDRKLTEIDERSVVDYRNYRRSQPLKRNPNRTLKGATVNRELACLHCMFQSHSSESTLARIQLPMSNISMSARRGHSRECSLLTKNIELSKRRHPTSGLRLCCSFRPVVGLTVKACR